MIDDREKSLTLGLARDRFLDSINRPTGDPEDDEIDPEDTAKDLALQQQELAEKRHQEETNRALGLTDDQREDLWASFRHHQPIINACNVGVGITFLIGVHWALEAINRRLAGPAIPGQIQLLPSPFLWWFFAGFGALILPWGITLQLWALFGDRRKVHLYRQWQKQSNFKYKGGEFKNELGLYRWFVLLIALPIGIANMLALNMRSTLGPDAIQECGYAVRPCKTLPYADVRRMTYVDATKGSSSKIGASLVLDFKQGYRWSSSDWGDEIKDVDPAVVSFLTSKISLPVNSAAQVKDIPPLPK
jgi:hypothetical protein